MVTSPSLSRLQARHWALVALAAGGSSAAGRPGVGGVLLGGGLIGLSVLLYSLAFLGLGFWAFASGREHRPDPIGFAVGLTCFPVAAVWEAMRVRGS